MGVNTVISSRAFGATGALGLAPPLPFNVALNPMLTQWLIKIGYEIGYEIVATPLTYVFVGYLQRCDNRDVHDRHTNFSPVIFGQESETNAFGGASTGTR